MLSGDIDHPRLDADTVVVNDGLIVAIGLEKDCDTSHAQRVIDAKRTTLAPGLIDSHCHPVFGDWTPRQSQLVGSTRVFTGGVTTMISAGEVHLAGSAEGHRWGKAAGDYGAARVRRAARRRRRWRGEGPRRPRR